MRIFFLKFLLDFWREEDFRLAASGARGRGCVASLSLCVRACVCVLVELGRHIFAFMFRICIISFVCVCHSLSLSLCFSKQNISGPLMKVLYIFVCLFSRFLV